MNEASPIAAAVETVPPAPRPAVAPVKIGVLLVNLGTPDAADAPGVRRYLKEFLSDPRVIENQGAVWKLVLNGIVLPIRPRLKARDYRKIWNIEQNESPLKTITRAQAEKLATTLEPIGAHLKVDWAMATRQSRRDWRRWSPTAASASWCCRSILSIPRRPRPRSGTRCSAF
jgi:ferrochelatase